MIYIDKKYLVIYLIIFTILLTACSESDYEIYSIDKMGTENFMQYTYHVVVKKELNEEELNKISKDIIEKAKREKSFNSIRIHLYDYEEYIEEGTKTLGSMIYAPYGDWSKATEVTKGDYSEMEYKDLIHKNKDWSKRLTQEEVNILFRWYDRWDKAYDLRVFSTDEEELIDEEKITEEIALEFDITQKEVKDIMDKHTSWIFSGEQSD